MADENPPRIRALNSVGLRRAGISSEAQKELRHVFKRIYLSNEPVRVAIASLNVSSLTPESRELISFYEGGKRSVMSGPAARKAKAPGDNAPEA